MARSYVASSCFTLLLSASLVAPTSVIAADTKNGRTGLERLRQHHIGSSVISAIEFRYTLRICNAYPSGEAMDVYHGKDKLTHAPMPYKACEDFFPHLQNGDKIEFRVERTGDLHVSENGHEIGFKEFAGSFSVSELPASDAVLALVIYRHDTSSSAMSFSSHIFSNALRALPRSSQLAVLDAYTGTSDAKIHVRDTNVKKKTEEEFRLNSILAVDQGKYELALQGADGHTKAKDELVAVARKTYVVVRCGVQSKNGKAYPEELIVFPRSDGRMFSAAASSKFSHIGVAFAGLLSIAVVLFGLFGALWFVVRLKPSVDSDP